MATLLRPDFIDHVVLIVKDIKATEQFYSNVFGEAHHLDEYSVAYKIGHTKLFFVLPFKDAADKTFDRNRIGLNHIAFGVQTLEELRTIEAQLNDAEIKNSGIIKDKYKDREYIWFDDPDGMRPEFYLRPEHEK